MLSPRPLVRLRARCSGLGEELRRMPAGTAALQGLGRVNTALVHRVAAEGQCHKATLDHAGTLPESHKREGLPAYQGRRYQPAALYWDSKNLAAGLGSATAS